MMDERFRRVRAAAIGWLVISLFTLPSALKKEARQINVVASFPSRRTEYECTEESLTAALGCLKDALAIDPAYAQAMALAAYRYARGSIQSWSHDVGSDAKQGLRLALRALEHGKDDDNVLWMAAYAVRRFDQDVQRARDLAYRSLASYGGRRLDGSRIGKLR